MIHKPKPFVKRLEYDAYRADGEPVMFNISLAQIKTASALDNEIIKWAQSHDLQPNHERCVVNALGLHEGFGPNVNGDSFYEEDMLAVPKNVFIKNKPYDKPMYQTFLDFSRVYQQHKNKPHDKAYGDVRFAYYNPKMRRIELVIDFYADDPDNEDMLNDMEHGIFPDVSMGFRCVPGDVCPVCRNFEKPYPSRQYYCDHLRNHMLEVDPATGILNHARNNNGYFFDISRVKRGADRTAGGLIVVRPKSIITPGEDQVKAAEIAFPEFVEYSSKVAEEDGTVEEVERMEGKEASVENSGQVEINHLDVIKDDPDPEFRVFGLPMMERTERPLSKEAMDYISSMPPADINLTLSGVGIMPTPVEFQYMILSSLGHEKQAEYLYDNGIVFDPSDVEEPDFTFASDTGSFNDKVAMTLRQEGILDERSALPPFLMARAAMVKEALSIGEFHERYPIIKNPLPRKKIPEDHQQRMMQQGIDRSAVGQYYQNHPGPVMNDGRYVSPRPNDVTSKLQSSPIIPLTGIAALYAGARWLTGMGGEGPLGRAMRNDPRVAAGAFGAAAALSWAIGRVGLPDPKQATIGQVVTQASKSVGKVLKNLENDYFLHLLGGIATSYGLAQRAATKREMGIQPGMVEQIAERNPGVGSLIAAAGLAGGIRGATNLISKFASDELTRLEDGILMNDNIIEFYEPAYLDKMARKSFIVSGLTLKKDGAFVDC